MKLRRKDTGVIWSVDEKYFNEFKNDKDFEVVEEHTPKKPLKAPGRVLTPQPTEDTSEEEKPLKNDLKTTPKPSKPQAKRNLSQKNKNN